ncbi:MAG: glycerophosphodiester phosphodiesterase, partial [Polyangiales bacterium]
TTSGHGAVDQITFDDLRKLTIKTGELQGDFSCEKVPTLKELLETCRGNALVLVDGNKTDRVDLMVQAIKDADALDWAVFDTSSLDKIDQALAIEPKLMIMPRVGTIDEATMVLAKYKDHLPVFVEVEATAFPKPAEAIHAGGSRVLTDVFTTDVIVKLGTSPKEKYLDVYAAGADVAQSDLPDLVLQALGRPVPP